MFSWTSELAGKLIFKLELEFRIYKVEMKFNAMAEPEPRILYG
jgi:hypothetical protein